METVKLGRNQGVVLFVRFRSILFDRFIILQHCSCAMKTNALKRSKKTASGMDISPTAKATENILARGAEAAVPKAKLRDNGNVSPLLMPDPETLLLEADQEPNYRNLADYVGVIRTLREKGFTYRDVAEWLTERGVEADHNAVYRVYTKNMSDLDAIDEARREEEEARDEAMRNR